MMISEALGVTSAKLFRVGAADGVLGFDSRLHIDPALLRTTRKPEFVLSYKRFEKYFGDVLTLLIAAEKVGGALEKRAVALLVFPEIKEAALGYSKLSTSGRGVSPTLAKGLYDTAKEIVDAGVRDPAIFELAIIFQESFGPDLISDMTLWVILDDISEFNRRVCEKLEIESRVMTSRRRRLTAAWSTALEKPILLLPHVLLRDLPEAESWEDIGRVAEYNDAIRATLNKMFGDNWAQRVKSFKKRDLRQLLIAEPEILKALISGYRASSPQPYDFQNDPRGEVRWYLEGRNATAKHPINLTNPKSPAEAFSVVKDIVFQFRHLIMENGLCDMIFTDEGKPRPEKQSQRLFFAVADSYCRANRLDISPEVNSGQGPVDFKISSSYSARILVELKLSKNSAALDGFMAQLPAYGKAERTDQLIYVLIITGDNRAAVDRLRAVHNSLKKQSKAVPTVVVIDAFGAYEKPSASNLKFNWENFEP